MAANQPVALLGRLAVQLKLIDMDQLREATAEQARHGSEKKLGAVLLEKGFINEAQLAKLQQVQRDVIVKHRAKQAASGRSAPAPPQSQSAPPAAKPRAVVEKQREAPGAAPPQEAPAAAKAPASSVLPDDLFDAAPPAAPPAARAPAPAPVVDRAPIEIEAPADEAPLELDTPRNVGEGGAPREAHPVAPIAAPAPIEFDPDPEDARAPAPSAPVVSETVGGDDLELRLADPSAAHEERLHAFLQQAVSMGASDVHIHALATPKVRVHGELKEISGEPLSVEEAEGMVAAALTPEERVQLRREGELDLCNSIEGIGRFRTNVYRQQRGFDAVFRSVAPQPPTLEELGLPSELAKHTNYHQGMVLVTGPAGCGKSATMAALVNLINEERDEHILTVEDPIEIVHPSKRCLVNQRHAGKHTSSFAHALRGALREDPDVIVIGELRDLETISLAMTAAETGHFVLATLHTNNAVRTINRMIGAFPSGEQGQVRTMLSESLRAVISQRLVETADESGRVPALEMLVINKAIGNLIRDEKTIQIRSSIQTGGAHGMFLLEQSLNQLVKDGTITKETALRYAEEKKLITAG